MTQTYILGAYTKFDNEGLHTIDFDEKDGKFSNIKLIKKLTNPTYVAMNPSLGLLFSLHSDQGRGGLVVLKKLATGDWEEVDSLFTSKKAGCHICFRQESSTLYVSNYHEGALDVYQLSSDLKLSHLQRICHKGSSIHPNQTSPHIHFSGMGIDRSLLYVCDLGTDTISAYRIDDQGRLDLTRQIKLEAGTGPRHLAFHPSQPYAYVVGELNNRTSVIHLAGASGMEVLQSLNNLDKVTQPDTAGAAIRLTSDGRFLYVSTRYTNRLTVFKVKDDGKALERVQVIDSIGQVPRDILLDRSENYLLVPHQDSDHVSVFQRDSHSGYLKFLNNDQYAPECVCIYPT